MGRDARTNPQSAEFTGEAHLLDGLGRRLNEGDEIILTAPRAQLFRVMQVTPVLDPRAAPGTLMVHLVSTTGWISQRNTPNPEFLLVRQAADAPPSPIQMLPRPTEAARPDRGTLEIVSPEKTPEVIE